MKLKIPILGENLGAPEQYRSRLLFNPSIMERGADEGAQ